MNDLISRQEDLISREVALTHIDDVPYIKDHPNVGLLWKAWIENLPPAHQEKRTQERTETRACDLVSRQDAIDAVMDEFKRIPTSAIRAKTRIEALPSAQPEPSDAVYRLYKRAYEAGQRNAQPEPHYDEWCTDCKEYDKERHCCPRWNRVIRETLKDAQPEIIHCRDCKYGEQDEIGRWYCRSLGCQIGDDDGSGFCADAERREE